MALITDKWVFCIPGACTQCSLKHLLTVACSCSADSVQVYYLSLSLEGNLKTLLRDEGEIKQNLCLVEQGFFFFFFFLKEIVVAICVGVEE